MNELTNLFKLLSDETRLRIIVLLGQEELCVCEMCGILELSQPKVSKHLAKLRDNGFVRDERKEQFIFYSLNIKDPVLESLITNIIDNIENYPQLKADSERLVDKEIYSKQCNPNSTKKLS
ncbi:metalloregulator ArsR/SmtB family transcription factor [Clostridium sp. cel8]|jgi:ArsR family transcriptional regulator, arsenate/arsenite/antimonite-responsive transcriptional repressor|uniref:ArsR/SmtB family transcription factor n=1 Tax=unclassified Clostridium TaxID=2614128 RepID=UPI0015F5FCDB|nr:metalloregulator ArsR/SmtB family transcription factor [Clostridium sp. cel8]MBA5851544.1 metalloregulator ArsR/SmtB family transcription factor [Clostridium sp. cel8]